MSPLSALSQVTSRIGFVATASTTNEDPYLLARKLASLDYISKSRAAWNVVTTGAPGQDLLSVPSRARLRQALSARLRSLTKPTTSD
ncbi:LLM class flavin-dependent oxidoreductase [Neorhizobium sp. LjRoot104]|uniref:LLM class flavin-dependent oxidoreductase n=1 Tax=Neorhizobium sp. LjRoot104 TaxID=3342254 RepID=UPI003ECDC3A7